MKIKEILKPYFEYYNDGYTLKVDDKIIPATSNFWTNLYPKTKRIELTPNANELQYFPPEIRERKFGRDIVPRKVLKLLSPDNIDNKKFWKLLDPKYKLLAVCGTKVETQFEANRMNLQGAVQALQVIQPIVNQVLVAKDRKLKVLEIGYGFGSFAEWIHGACGYSNKYLDYYGIDVVKRTDAFKNLFVTDGWKIPKEVPRDLDIVYSTNVFQHLSQKQRFNYLKKAYKRLKIGGKMVFSSFIMTEENKNSVMWGLVDEKGRGYCHFFSQPTEVDYDTELKEKIEEIGFRIDEFKVHGINHLFCSLTKVNKEIKEIDPYGEEQWDENPKKKATDPVGNFYERHGYKPV